MQILSATVQIEGHVLSLSGDRGTLIVEYDLAGEPNRQRREFAFAGEPSALTSADRAFTVLRVLDLEGFAASAVDLDDLGHLIDEVRQ